MKYNVMVSKKIKGEIRCEYFSAYTNEVERDKIQAFISSLAKEKFPGYLLGAYAPASDGEISDVPKY